MLKAYGRRLSSFIVYINTRSNKTSSLHLKDRRRPVKAGLDTGPRHGRERLSISGRRAEAGDGCFRGRNKQQNQPENRKHTSANHSTAMETHLGNLYLGSGFVAAQAGDLHLCQSRERQHKQSPGVIALHGRNAAVQPDYFWGSINPSNCEHTELQHITGAAPRKTGYEEDPRAPCSL